MFKSYLNIISLFINYLINKLTKNPKINKQIIFCPKLGQFPYDQWPLPKYSNPSLILIKG